MDTGESLPAQPAVRLYAVCYALYLIVLVLCFYAFWVWRNTIETLVHLAVPHDFSAGFWYLLGNVVTGLLLFGVAIASEAYLREGIRLHRLRNRFARLAGQLVVAVLVGAALQEVMYRAG